MKLSAEQTALLPSVEDVAYYREHGYYVSPPILTEDAIDNALYGSERFYAGERDFFLPSNGETFSGWRPEIEGWRPEHGDVIRQNDYTSLQNREISELVHHPLIGAIASRLCGSPTIRLWHDQLIYKPIEGDGRETSVGWHTDRVYWKTCASTNLLTAWVALHDCDNVMGTLLVIDGSHQWSGEMHLKGFHSSDLAGLEKHFSSPADGPLVKVPINVKKGQVSFHHCMTIHGSGPNLGHAPRRSLSIHMQDESNHYRERREANGDLAWHRNDMLCRRVNGVPDYSDPEVCPILWDED